MKMLSNRDALIVTPKRAFYEWVKNLDESDLDEKVFMSTRSIYLIEIIENNSYKEIQATVETLCPEIISSEILAWHEDEAVIPESLDFALFTSWFDWSYTDTLFDMEPDAVEGEEIG